MRPPNPEQLTGNKRFRVTAEGLLVLQVEMSGLYQRAWRDARVEDITTAPLSIIRTEG